MTQNVRGSAIFQCMTEEEQAVARFLIKMFRLDENSVADVIHVHRIIESINK